MDKLSGALIRDSNGKTYSFEFGPDYTGTTSVPSIVGSFDMGMDVNNYVYSVHNHEYYYTLIDGLLGRKTIFSPNPDDNIYEVSIFPSGVGININSLAVDELKSNVYIGNDLGQVMKFDQNLDNGNNENKPIWTVLSGGTVNEICIAEDSLSIYVAKSNGIVYKLSATDGSIIWQADVGESVSSIGVDSREMVYGGTVNGKVFSLTSTGAVNSSDYVTGGGITKTIVSLHDVVLFGTTDGKIYRGLLDDNSVPATEWIYDAQSRITALTITGDGTRLLCGCLDGNIHRIDLDTGKKIWWGMPDSTSKSIVSLNLDSCYNIVAQTASGPLFYIADVIIL